MRSARCRRAVDRLHFVVGQPFEYVRPTLDGLPRSRGRRRHVDIRDPNHETLIATQLNSDHFLQRAAVRVVQTGHVDFVADFHDVNIPQERGLSKVASFLPRCSQFNRGTAVVRLSCFHGSVGSIPPAGHREKNHTRRADSCLAAPRPASYD